jgi:hypothetical protein
MDEEGSVKLGNERSGLCELFTLNDLADFGETGRAR